jgi:uncharacterized sulfatase
MLVDPSAKVKDAAFTQVRRRDSQGRSIRTDHWRFTEWTGQGAGLELYDHANDPNEWNNLAADPANAGTIKELTVLLDRNAPRLPMRDTTSAPTSRPNRRVR